MSGDINVQACRVCLKENAKTHNIFENPTQNECFASMLTAIADVKILKGDSLPKNICIPCSEVLIKAFKLKVLAEKTDAFLQFKSKQIIIKKLDPDLIKFKNKSKLTIKAEPNTSDIFSNDDIFTNKTRHIDDDIFNEAPKKTKALTSCDFFSEPIVKTTEKTPLKDDIFFKDNNINENESLFGNDDHFADNDDFDISSNNKPVIKKKMFKEPITKKANQSAKKTTPVKRKVHFKQVTFKKSFFLKVPKLKPKFVSIRAGSENDRFVCTVCGLLVANIGQHMKSHKDYKFTCPVCKMVFEKRSEYHVHTLSHGAFTRKYICDVCPIRFFTMKALKRHKLSHAEKKFECDICPIKFNCRSDLKRHMKRHLGVKPFVCQCGQAFIDRNKLTRHVLTHTGEKMYQCQICDIDFSYKQALNKHVLKNHGVNIRFQSLYKVTEESLRMITERAALEGLCEADARSKMFSQRKTRKVAYINDDDQGSE